MYLSGIDNFLNHGNALLEQRIFSVNNDLYYNVTDSWTLRGSPVEIAFEDVKLKFLNIARIGWYTFLDSNI